jgi:hypothetical protein
VRRRQRWRTVQGGLDPTRLDFVDETWIKTNLAPLHGWRCFNQEDLLRKP